MAKETRRPAPTTVSPIKAAFVNLGAAIELGNLMAVFRDRLAGRVQTVAGKRLRNVFASMTGEQKADI